MAHNWLAYNIAKTIADSLIEGELIKRKDMLKIRGIIQIALEDNIELKRRKREVRDGN